MHFDGKSDAMKGFFESLELPSALHWEHVQSIDVTDDKISIAFDESKPLLQKNIFDVNLGSPLEIEMTVDPEEGIALKPKLEGDWALDIIFSKDPSQCDGQRADVYALGALDEALTLAGSLSCGD